MTMKNEEENPFIFWPQGYLFTARIPHSGHSPTQPCENAAYLLYGMCWWW